VLQLSLRPEAADRIADHTRENAGSYLAVALNGEVVSAPLIMSTIEGGVIQLEGTDPTEFAAFAPCFGR
jgi:preprotein translocase subunit SecD